MVVGLGHESQNIPLKETAKLSLALALIELAWDSGRFPAKALILSARVQTGRSLLIQNNRRRRPSRHGGIIPSPDYLDLFHV